MSNIITNLRVRFGADTSKFKKGMKEGDRAMKDFTTEGKSAFSDFARAFGVNIDGISSQTKVFTAGLGAMSGGMKGAAASSGGLTKALRILKVALASTGIGALVVALGSLVSYFTKTKRGGDALARVMDSIGAIVSVLVDRASALGESLVAAFSNPKETITSLWEFLKSQFLNRIAAIPQLIQSAWNIVKGIFTGGSKEAAAEFGRSYLQLVTGLDTEQQNKVAGAFAGVGQEIRKEASAAYDLKRRLQELEDAEIKLIEVNSERSKQIEELRNKSKELRDTDIDESRKALQEAMNIEQARLNDELRIARERAAIMEEQKALGENLREDDRELAEAKAKVNELERASLAYRRRMITEMQTLNREYDTYNANLIKAAQASEAEMPEGRLEAASLGAFTIDTSQLKPVLAESLGDFISYAEQVGEIFFNMGEMIEGTLEGMTVSFAESFGEILAGTASFGDISTLLLAPLADMAINVGKIAIGTGIAVKEIIAALKLQPWAAVAAGVALVALGTAVKASLKKAGSGGTSFGGSSGNFSFDTRGGSGTSAISTSTGGLQPQPIQVEVSGEFRQSGRDLVATVNKENQRTNLTAGR